MDEISQDKTMVFLTDANVTELNNFSADKNAADEADTFVAKAMIKVMTLGYKSDDFKQAVIQAVSATLPSGQGLLTSDADTIATQLKDNNINTGKITILGKLDSHVGPKIDIAGMTKSWRLKRLKTIRQSIENIPGATVGDISITPSIALPLAPILSSHMTLNLEYTKK